MAKPRPQQSCSGEALSPWNVPEDACFAAQQAAEKAINAVMVLCGTDFPYIHDLAGLMDILESKRDVIPGEHRRADRLTQYATATR